MIISTQVVLLFENGDTKSFRPFISFCRTIISYREWCLKRELRLIAIDHHKHSSFFILALSGIASHERHVARDGRGVNHSQSAVVYFGEHDTAIWWRWNL